MKRALPPADGDTGSTKKARTGPMVRHCLRHTQPGALRALANPQDPQVLDSQVDRGLSVALHLAGFNAVKTDAFESLRGAMHEYMTHFSTQVATAMRAARRTRPDPADFTSALRTFNLRLDSLYPDLKTPVPPEATQPILVMADPASSTYNAFETEAKILLGKTFGNGEKEKRQRSWVPKHLPNFPPVHTYKTSAVMTERETDARRIRELAMQEGEQAERALRRLVAARKPGRRSQRGGAFPDQHQKNEDAFREVMAAVLEEERDQPGLEGEDRSLVRDGATDRRAPDSNDDFGITAVVNWDRVNWRHRAARDLLGAS